MPQEERNEEHQGNKDEEWEAGHPGCVPCVWHKDVQDRQGVEHRRYLDPRYLDPNE